MCVSRPLAHHLSCAHFTASLKYHRYMKHIPLIHNYVCYLYRKTLRIKKVENWFYNIDSSSGFFFCLFYLKVLFSGWQSHMQEMGTSPKHTWVVPFFTLLWTQGWHSCVVRMKNTWVALSCPLCLLLLLDKLLWIVCQLWILLWWPSVFVASFCK